MGLSTERRGHVTLVEHHASTLMLKIVQCVQNAWARFHMCDAVLTCVMLRGAWFHTRDAIGEVSAPGRSMNNITCDQNK